MTLHDIGLRHGTDKATYHDFCRIYEKELAHLKTLERPRILELGVLNGASLAMWQEWLPNAEVWGADIAVRTNKEQRLIQCDLSKAEHVILMHEQTGGGRFDLIIDDASHVWAHQRIAFNILKHFADVYVIEDVHTSNWDAYQEAGENPIVEIGSGNECVVNLDYQSVGFVAKFYTNKPNDSWTLIFTKEQK
jgi:hypothetical protein